MVTGLSIPWYNACGEAFPGSARRFGTGHRKLVVGVPTLDPRCRLVEVHHLASRDLCASFRNHLGFASETRLSISVSFGLGRAMTM